MTIYDNENETTTDSVTVAADDLSVGKHTLSVLTAIPTDGWMSADAIEDQVPCAIATVYRELEYLDSTPFVTTERQLSDDGLHRVTCYQREVDQVIIEF